MRIILEGMTVDDAITLQEWLTDKRAEILIKRLSITEEALIEKMLRSPTKDQDAVEIRALRSFPALYQHLKDFIEQNKDEKNVNNSVDME